MNFIDVVPTNIQAIQPYKPGKPLEEVERELGIKAVKMASNENPLGPSPKALDAMRKYIEHVELYPDDTGYYLRQKLAERLNVSMDELILGSGSSDILAMAFNAMLTANTEVLTSEGSFIVYYLLGQMKGCDMVRTPMREFAFDLAGMAERFSSKTRLVLIANPNNPTGTIVRRKDLDSFMAKVPDHALVILDEAYFEYVQDGEYPDSFKYFREGKNVLIIRTFSKAYGLAGLRIGYGIGRADIIDTLQKVRLAFNTGSLGQVAALAALDDQLHVQRTVESNRREIDFLFRELSVRGVKYVPSCANFVFMDTGKPAKDVDAAMLRQGVIIRPMAGWGFPNHDSRFRWHTRSERKVFKGARLDYPMTIKEILETYKTIAVVGLSNTPWRASQGVSRYMQASGYRIIPVNPHETEVLGQKSYPSLDEVPEPFEIVDIFRRSEYVPEIVEAAIRKGAKVIWMQETVVHEAAAERARQAGMEVVMDRCILKEHMHYF